jgi:hypothetical protein
VAATSLDEILARLQSQIGKSTLDNQELRILREILATGAEGNFLDYAAAEQAFMAVQMLVFEKRPSRPSWPYRCWSSKLEILKCRNSSTFSVIPSRTTSVTARHSSHACSPRSPTNCGDSLLNYQRAPRLGR